MLICGIYFGEKTLWDEISENIKGAELEVDKAFDRMKEETQGDKEPNELDVLVESLLNYKDVLEGKVRDLERENEKLHMEIERQDEEIEGLQLRNSSSGIEIRKINCKINAIRTRCREEARDLFDNNLFDMIEIRKAREREACDCGNLKKQIEELQSEVRDLKAENLKIRTRNENLKKSLETRDKEFEEQKERCETACLEREHLAKQIQELKGKISELNDRHQQDCIDLNKKQTTIDELVDNYSEMRRQMGLS